MSIGLDVGTSFLIKAEETLEGVKYTEFRDAFYRIKPPTKFAGKMIEKGLQSMPYFKDIDGSYVLVGQDAIEKAIERKVDQPQCENQVDRIKDEFELFHFG